MIQAMSESETPESSSWADTGAARMPLPVAAAAAQQDPDSPGLELEP
jgi:hypothetical protein